MGIATIYYAMPSGPDEASADSVRDWADAIHHSHNIVRRLVNMGWQPRWADNSLFAEFVELALDKNFESEDAAIAELENLNVGLNPFYDED